MNEGEGKRKKKHTHMHTHTRAISCPYALPQQKESMNIMRHDHINKCKRQTIIRTWSGLPDVDTIDRECFSMFNHRRQQHSVVAAMIKGHLATDDKGRSSALCCRGWQRGIHSTWRGGLRTHSPPCTFKVSQASQPSHPRNNNIEFEKKTDMVAIAFEPL